ncbi:hypothetical protein KIL84_021424 [Mauremys mutica]|uniref:Uncharacterized protein n=1 Tax=Mauremys mutica TaxID=74926 RepID=A0A9D3X9L0_9SAUR|nr:hypothetical protein KIL84_021424 [Mauremys mutica]
MLYGWCRNQSSYGGTAKCFFKQGKAACPANAPPPQPVAPLGRGGGELALGPTPASHPLLPRAPSKELAGPEHSPAMRWCCRGGQWEAQVPGLQGCSVLVSYLVGRQRSRPCCPSLSG